MTKESKVLNEAEAEAAFRSPKNLVAELVLVNSVGGQPRRLSYDQAEALKYWDTFCAGGNDCPNNSYPLDCTHFCCHGLAKGDVKIKQPSHTCDSYLGTRVNDLAASFYNSLSAYDNVKQIQSHAATKKGDFCFIPGWFGLSKDHVMILNGTAVATGAPVWGHTSNRCGTFVNFEGEDCVYYRID